MDKQSLDLLDYALIKDMQININNGDLITIDISLVIQESEFLEIVIDYLTRDIK